MGNPYLNRDESIILTTHNVNFNSVVTEVIFTNQRLILFDSRHPQFRYQTIPLATIETVMIREDAQDNPVILLSISPITPDSPPQSKELTFSRQTTGDRKRECEEWVKQLKEQIASVRLQASLPLQPETHQDTDIIFEDITTGGPEQVPAAETPVVPDAGPGEPIENSPSSWREADIGSAEVLPDTVIPASPEPEGSLGEDSPKTPEMSSLPDSSNPPPAQPSRPKLIAVTALVVILALVAGAFIYSTVLQGNASEPVGNSGCNGHNHCSNHDPDALSYSDPCSPDYTRSHPPAYTYDSGKWCLGKSTIRGKLYRARWYLRKPKGGERFRRPVLPDPDK